jgi:predicted peptidase
MSEKAGLNFLLYLPDQYGADADKKWPLLLFLHGSGERGDDLDALKVGGLVEYLKVESDFPFIVVSPQLAGKEVSWSEDDTVESLFTLIEEIQTLYAVDPTRIYLAGFSLGGAGVWEIGLRHPHRFAALMPVSGYYDSSSYGKSREVPDHLCDLKETPIWAFHSAEDPVIPLKAQQLLVDALKACDGDVQMTVYPGSRHDITDEVFANPELYDWLMSRQRK